MVKLYDGSNMNEESRALRDSARSRLRKDPGAPKEYWVRLHVYPESPKRMGQFEALVNRSTITLMRKLDRGNFIAKAEVLVPLEPKEKQQKKRGSRVKSSAVEGNA